MALNWAMLDVDRTPVPLPHETTIRSIESGADITLTIPETPPSGTASSGGSGGVKILKATGRLWLTDQRFIFVSVPSKSLTIDSLSVPLIALLSTKFRQPLLSGNHLEIDIEPSPEGGLTNGTNAEIRLKDRGLYEFACALDKSRERAVEVRRNRGGEEGEGLPEYSSSTVPSIGGPSTASGGVPRPEEPPAYEL